MNVMCLPRLGGAWRLPRGSGDSVGSGGMVMASRKLLQAAVVVLAVREGGGKRQLPAGTASSIDSGQFQGVHMHALCIASG